MGLRRGGGSPAGRSPGRGSDRPGTVAEAATRSAVTAALVVAAVVTGSVVAGLATRRDEGPPTIPPGADDPLNRPVLIEGGFFWKGNPDPDTVSFGPYVTWDESYAPETVEGFWIQEHEVTNREYRRFDPDHAFPAGRERHPVVLVTWQQASDYAASLGGRLPTETEWEFAARGTESRKYPWGDEPVTCERAHYGACRPRTTIAVMSRPNGVTPEGVHDLAGNVWEWVVPDWFLLGNFPANNETRMSRGGSFRDEPFFLRAANRNKGYGFHGSFRTDNLGFRVVWPVGDG